MSYPFVQARNFTRGRSGSIDVLVIHAMEAKEKPETAENVASWFAGPDAPRASAHYCIDANSIVQCVQDWDVAWHAPGANHNGIGFEHAGYSAQTGRDWSDAYSTAMLKRSAKLVAEKAKKNRIPVRWLSVGDLQAGRRGITSHNNVSLAFRRSDHTDPGKGFPVTAYLAMVTKAIGDVGKTNPDVSYPPLGPKDRGFQVKRVQRLLRQHGLRCPVNGTYGTLTYWAVRRFQKKRGLKVDGQVGPKTWKKLLAVPA